MGAAYAVTLPQVLQPEAATVNNGVLVVRAKLKYCAVASVDWKGPRRSVREGEEQTWDMDTHYLTIDHVS